jgi:hypothetical protein
MSPAAANASLLSTRKKIFSIFLTYIFRVIKNQTFSKSVSIIRTKTEEFAVGIRGLETSAGITQRGAAPKMQPTDEREIFSEV